MTPGTAAHRGALARPATAWVLGGLLLALAITRVLEVHGTVAVAAATLAAVALFTPLRRRVQRIVDRQFNRARYDADRTVATFAARLQDAIELRTVRDDLLAVVADSLEPAHVSIWIAGGRR